MGLLLNFSMYQSEKQPFTFIGVITVAFSVLRFPPVAADHHSNFTKILENGGKAMWQRNNGQSEAEKLQNRFTSYLVTAVNRRRKDYMNQRSRRICMESYLGGRSLVFRI